MALLFLLLSLSYGAETRCPNAREYITTLEYLRDHKAYAIPEPEARKIAQQVSQSCAGAAQRFTKTMSTLSKAGFSGTDSLKIASEFAAKTDVEAETFVHVFIQVFSEDYLDLDLQSAVRLAKSLTVEFHGDILEVRRDFDKLVKFCMRGKDVELPKPTCAQLAARIARLGEKDQGGIADSFIKGFRFISSEQGPHLTTAQALEMAEKTVGGGRDAVENFILAYRYGVSAKGLAQPVQEALQFAREMAGG